MASFFIDTDGFLFKSGANKYGFAKTNIFEQINNHKFKSISNSDSHLMVIDEDGFLWASGDNCNGQLGLGDLKDRNKLVKISDDKQFIMVSCGENHTVAIDKHGDLLACGDNSYGQCSLDAKRKPKLKKITTATKFIMISCGPNHTMAIDEFGYLWGCGLCHSGQLGIGDFINRDKLEKITTETTFVMVSCGSTHTMAIDVDGTLWGCGSGSSGLGACTYKLTKVSICDKIKMVSCGFAHTVAVDVNGFLWGCGLNWEGSLGLGDNLYRRNHQKVQIDDNPVITTVICGRYHSMAVDENGVLYVCGLGTDGQLGLGDYNDKNQWVKVDNINKIQTLMNNPIVKKRGSNTKSARGYL
jgi:alpha-tubulin suppressor-like RCC1 family protein